jgi:hypothetical protein
VTNHIQSLPMFHLCNLQGSRDHVRETDIANPLLNILDLNGTASALAYLEPRISSTNLLNTRCDHGSANPRLYMYIVYVTLESGPLTRCRRNTQLRRCGCPRCKAYTGLHLILYGKGQPQCFSHSGDDPKRSINRGTEYLNCSEGWIQPFV